MVLTPISSEASAVEGAKEGGPSVVVYLLQVNHVIQKTTATVTGLGSLLGIYSQRKCRGSWDWRKRARDCGEFLSARLHSRCLAPIGTLVPQKTSRSEAG